MSSSSPTAGGRQERRLKRRLYLAGSCGSCAACCTAMHVVELDKPSGQACSHLRPDTTGGGCSIYETRPASCREWACVWRSGTGLLRPDERPDQIGIMLDTWAPPGGVKALLVYPLTEEPSAKAAEVLERLVRNHLLVFMMKDGTRPVIGPKERVDAFMSWPEKP